MVGHMVLFKSLAKDNLGTTGTGSSSSSATILGLKVVGGTLLSNGRIGAVIEKVKKGSVADDIGHLLPGMYNIIFEVPGLAHPSVQHLLISYYLLITNILTYILFFNRRRSPRMERYTFSRQILRRSPTYYQRISPGFPSGASCSSIINWGPCSLGSSVRPTRTVFTIKSLPWRKCRGGRAFQGAWPLSDSKWPPRGNDTYVKSSSSGLHKNSGKVE